MALHGFALTTVEPVRVEVNAEATKDAILERLIHAGSRAISKLAGGRVFEYDPAIVEDLRLLGHTYGQGSRTIMVQRTPLLSIASIELIDQAGDTQETYEVDTYNIEKADAGIIYRELGWPCFDIYRVRVTYEGGYVTPAQVENGQVDGDNARVARTLPEDLEEAAIMTVVSLWSRRGQDREIASANSENGHIFTYREAGDIVPLEALRLINAYRRSPS